MSHAWIRRLLIVALLAAFGAGGFLVWQRLHPKTDERELTLYGNVDIREVQLAINGNDHHPYVDAADFAWVGIAILLTLIVVIPIYEYFF